MTDRFYIICSSLEWKLGCHMSEWLAARELAYRMGKAGDDLNRAHLDGVLRLLREHLAELEVPVLDDRTRCHGIDCHQKHQCARHTAPVPDNTLLSWASNLNPERAHLCAWYTACLLGTM